MNCITVVASFMRKQGFRQPQRAHDLACAFTDMMMDILFMRITNMVTHTEYQRKGAQSGYKVVYKDVVDPNILVRPVTEQTKARDLLITNPPLTQEEVEDLEADVVDKWIVGIVHDTTRITSPNLFKIIEQTPRITDATHILRSPAEHKLLEFIIHVAEKHLRAELLAEVRRVRKASQLDPTNYLPLQIALAK